MRTYAILVLLAACCPKPLPPERPKTVMITESCLLKSEPVLLPVKYEKCDGKICMTQEHAANLFGNVKALKDWVTDAKKNCTSTHTGDDELPPDIKILGKN